MNTNCFNAEPPGREAATLRDTFAAAALQGLVASNFYDRYKPLWELYEVKNSIPEVAAMIAYEYADAMLEYRKMFKP